MARLLLLLSLLATGLQASAINYWSFDFEGETDSSTTTPGRPLYGWTIINASFPQDDDGSTPGWGPAATGLAGNYGDRNNEFGYVQVRWDTSLADFNNSVISAWLISPVVDLTNAHMLSFWTRRGDVDGFSAADRMQVLLWKSTTEADLSGAGLPLGAGPTDMGSYDYGEAPERLLFDINPTYAQPGEPGAYPDNWANYQTYFTPPVSGNLYGRLAFRYYVNPSDFNGTSIGLDDVGIFTNIPEPATFLLIGAPLIALGYFRRRITHKTP